MFLGRSRWHVLDMLRPPNSEKLDPASTLADRVHGLSRRWLRVGTWIRILEQLQARPTPTG